MHLVLDVMLPAERVVDALKAFREQFPTVSLHLHVEALGGVTQRVLDRGAALGVSGPMTSIAGLERIGVGKVALIPVAAPAHPLARNGPHPPGARAQPRATGADRPLELTRDQEFAVVGTRTWRLADLGSKHMLLREGIGWGNMPAPMVADDLASGRLVRLELPDCPPIDYTFEVLYRTDTPPGPAATWLIERFKEQVAPLATLRKIEPDGR